MNRRTFAGTILGLFGVASIGSAKEVKLKEKCLLDYSKTESDEFVDSLKVEK